jgi:hypothetical protein
MTMIMTRRGSRGAVQDMEARGVVLRLSLTSRFVRHLPPLKPFRCALCAARE